MLLELGAAILEKGDNSEKLSWVLIKFKVLSLYLNHKSFDKIIFSEKNMRLKKRPTFGPLSTIGLSRVIVFRSENQGGGILTHNHFLLTLYI